MGKIKKLKPVGTKRIIEAHCYSQSRNKEPLLIQLIRTENLSSVGHCVRVRDTKIILFSICKEPTVLIGQCFNKLYS